MPNFKFQKSHVKSHRIRFIGNWKVEIRNSRRGFTLIEVLLVFSIISIISVASIFAYSTYNTRQQLNNSAQEILVLIHSAKAKAQSQITPTGCTSLKSYQIIRCAAGPTCKSVGANATTYELQAVCSNGAFAADSKNLSANVTFDSSSATTIAFSVLTGGVSAGFFKISNGVNSRTITVSSYGQITLSQN